MDNNSTLKDIQEYRQHFDAIYVGGIPRLFTEDSAFLGFMTMLTAIEALAGLYAPKKNTGERFRLFIKTYFPKEFREHTESLWEFRNAMIHSFNPGPFALTCHTSRNHLKTTFGPLTLNVEDFFGALLFASRSYFDALNIDATLQTNFVKRIAATDGGAPDSWEITEH